MRATARAVTGWLTLAHLSLLAVVAITAHAHWGLAITLGMPAWLAPALPVAVDAYVLSSFRAWEVQTAARDAGRNVRVRRGDLAWALGIDGLAVAGSHAATQLALPADVRAAAAAALGVILVLTLWRVHALDASVKATLRGMGQAAPKDKTRQKAGDTSPSRAVPVPAAPTVPALPASPPVPAPQPRPRQQGTGDTTGSLVDVPDGATLDEWVAAQFAAGARRVDVLAAGAARFGKDEKTVARRWAPLARAARTTELAPDPDAEPDAPAHLRAVQ